MTIKESSNLFKILTHWKNDIDNGYDKVILICGDEGKGKSTSLALPILSNWYEAILKKPIPKGRFCVDFKQFGNLLDTGKAYDICLADEAGDALYKKDHMATFNKLLYKTYTIIRGKKFVTCLVMPDFFDLDAGFRKRRVHGCFHVYKRVGNICKDCNKEFAGPKCPDCGSIRFTKGYVKYRYYTKWMLEKISEINRGRTIPKMNVVRGIEGKSWMYEGPLMDEYLPMKEEKMNTAIGEVKAALEEFKNEEKADTIRRCPNCGKADVKYTNNGFICRNCPAVWQPSAEEIANINKLGASIRKGTTTSKRTKGKK